MSAKFLTTSAMAAVLLAGGVWLLQGKPVMAKTYHMIFSGDAGAKFSGTCAIETSGGETVLTLEGNVPHEQDVVGHGMKCQLQTEGRVVIDIEHNGSRTRSATNGGKINIGLR
jgi:hypothetical protein